MRLHERQRVRKAEIEFIAAYLNGLLVGTGCTVRVMRPPRYLGQS